jgi:hypothetical protein
MQCRNHYVWRKQFVIRSQKDSESADSFSKLRDLAHKCENEKDLCNNCQKTWLRGQIVFGVSDNDVCQSVHFQSLFMRGNGSPTKQGGPSAKPETAGSISINFIQSDDMIQLNITPPRGSCGVIVSTLADSSASIDGILAFFYWN